LLTLKQSYAQLSLSVSLEELLPMSPMSDTQIIPEMTNEEFVALVLDNDQEAQQEAPQQAPQEIPQQPPVEDQRERGEKLSLHLSFSECYG